MSQVIITNPLEIIKIRLQVSGEVESERSSGVIQIIRELGFKGLYKGFQACWMRDIPFSAIYFTAYAHTKHGLANENGYNPIHTLFLSGLIAGVPAAFLVTPADVIKTRIQVRAREGQEVYTGVVDATKKIYVQEGIKAFYKGAIGIFVNFFFTRVVLLFQLL